MSIASLIVAFSISFGLLIIAMTAHEFAHGLTAYKLGDSTAKLSGRLSLNPLAHIDMFWTIILPLALFLSSGGQFLFGAAKPVPINYWALRNPKRDIIWIGLSGPLANFLLAFAFALALRIFPLPQIAIYLAVNLITINVILGVFNLLPIPPLDGSRVLMGLLPQDLADQYAQAERYGFFILFAMIWLGVFDRVLWPVVRLILGWLGVRG